MFRFFRKDIGKKISKPIVKRVQGHLRKSMEHMAYALENNQSIDQHVLCLVAQIDKDKEGINDDSGYEGMNCAFIRGSDASLCDMLLQTGIRDQTFAQAVIAVGKALQFHDPRMKAFADDLENDTSKIPGNSIQNRKSKSLFENLGKGMKGINLNDLMNASESDIDKMIGDMLKEDEENDSED